MTTQDDRTQVVFPAPSGDWGGLDPEYVRQLQADPRMRREWLTGSWDIDGTAPSERGAAGDWCTYCTQPGHVAASCPVAARQRGDKRGAGA